MAVNQQKLLGRKTTVQSAAVAPQQQLVAAPADTAALQDISKSLTKIIQLLTQQNVQVTKEANQERKNQELARRKKVELGLEGSFSAVKNVAQAVVAPVKNILDQIIQFFVALFLGKALLNLINWFANPENQNKVRSIARFLKDWWPSLIAGYILFGTGFGRVVRTLAGIAVRGVILLGGVTLKLTAAIAKAIGLKRTGTILSTLGGGGGGLKGILAKLAVGTAVTAGGAIAAKNMMGGGSEAAPQIQVPEAPALPVAQAFGGGLIDFKSMLAASGGYVDSKLGIFTQLFKSGGLASLLNGSPGVVSGPKGIDKVPAMLTDGEFVMSRGAVQKFGVGTLEAMNAAGGGTNRPKLVSTKVYADGGGYIGDRKNDAHDDPILSDNIRLSTEERLKRIESQLKIKRDLASGRGVQTSAGTGYGTTYQGRQSILVKNGTQKLGAGAGYDAITVPKINVGGMEYFAQQKGKDIIYSSNFARGLSGQVDKYGAKNSGYSGRGAGIVGGPGLKDLDKKNLPKSKIMMGPDGPFVAYLSFKGGQPTYQRPTQRNKGMLESLTDFFDPNGAKGRQETLNARTMRLTAISDLEDMRRRGMKEENIKKMMTERLGPNGYARAVNDSQAKISRVNKETSQKNLDRLTWGNVGPDMMPKRFAEENRVRKEEYNRRGGDWGGMGRFFQQLGGDAKTLSRIGMADRASEVKAKQAGAASIGRYYSSSDGKYYKDYAAADAARKARQARLAKSSPNRKPITPTPPPAPKVVSRSNSGRSGTNGGGNSGARPSVPQFSSSRGNNSTTKKSLGIRKG